MIRTVNGEIYHVYTETIEKLSGLAKDFFADTTHENDLIAADGCGCETIYVSSMDISNDTIDDGGFVHFSVRMFREARKNRHLMSGGIIPALNELGEPVCLLKLNPQKGYIHKYDLINEKPDIRVFDLYDIIVLLDVTEYAFVLLKDALIEYKGRIICVGKDWLDFAQLFPDRSNIEFLENKEKLPTDVLLYKTMYLMEFSSTMSGYEERCKDGFFSYDEIMTLVYFFSYRTAYGDKNPDKRYYLIDLPFLTEGLMAICHNCEIPYSYVEANGFIPVLYLVRSNTSMYSDFDGNDIWGKFFNQPYGKEANEWKNSINVWHFPYATLSFSGQWLMKRIVECDEFQLVNTFYINDRVKNEIDTIRDSVLPEPHKTLGVLIRGTDHTLTHLPGHPFMASPEQVMDKIKEFDATGDYDYIYLSTEDADVLEKMKRMCGKRLRYINQKRFRINPGELLFHQKSNRENDGWLSGKEYLTTLKLLSECEAFIASGNCTGTLCALNSGKDNFKKTFVFDLGF